VPSSHIKNQEIKAHMLNSKVKVIAKVHLLKHLMPQIVLHLEF